MMTRPLVMCWTSLAVYVAAAVFWLPPIYETLFSESLNWGALIMITLTVLGLSLLLVGTTKLNIVPRRVTVLKVSATLHGLATVFVIGGAIADSDPGGYLLGGILLLPVLALHPVITLCIMITLLSIREEQKSQMPAMA